MEDERAEYVQEGLPIGSYPSVVSSGETDGALQTYEAEDLPVADDRMAVLLDKLGERLSFERQGTRLYEAFIQKVEAMPIDDSNGPAVVSRRVGKDDRLAS